MLINIKKRFQNKTFCIAFISAIVLLIQQLGLGKYLPVNLMDIVNTVLTILVMLGVIIDPTTAGINDSNLVMQNIDSDELLNKMNKEE